MARPRITFDLAEVEKLSSMGCTNAEIAGWFDCTEQTIDNRIAKDKSFREAITRGRAKGRVSVRRQQMKMLKAGNATMGIWLGKQMLGQRDVVASEISGPEGKPIETGPMKIIIEYAKPVVHGADDRAPHGAEAGDS